MRIALPLLALVFALPAAAQQRGPTAEQALERARQVYGPPAPAAAQDPTIERCTAEQEAAAISGEIVVCRRVNAAEAVSGFDREDWERRYAARTMDRGDPHPPVANGPNSGIFTGPATVSGLCLIPPCPPPPAYMIDFETLPDAPEGSDADLIAKGLKPAR